MDARGPNLFDVGKKKGLTWDLCIWYTEDNE